LGGRDKEDRGLNSAQANSWRDPILKISNTKRAGGVAQVVECLLSKHEVLSSNSNTTKKKKE
jgi:hypothetical protein